MFAIIFALLQYDLSKADRDPMKEIVVDHVDTFEVLSENLARPTNTKVFDATGLAGVSFNKNDYPWPGHQGSTNDATRKNIIKESNKIKDFFGKRCNFTQDELGYHVTAFDQERTTQEILSKPKAIKVKLH